MKKKVIACFAAVLMLLSSLTVIGCKEKLTLSTEGGVISVQPGKTVQFLVNVKADAEDLSFRIDEGAASASMSESGLLTVNADAQVGAQIKVSAKYKEIVSNTVTVTVAEIPLTGINSAAADKLSMVAGESTTLSYVLSPLNTTQKDIAWELVGDTYKDHVTFEGNVLTAKATAPSGTISFRAKRGSIVSNTAAVSIVVHLTAITDPQSSKAYLLPGETAELTCVLQPENTTEKAIEWEITNGYQHAEITGNMLKLTENAVKGDIKLRAKFGTITSPEITVHAVLSQEDKLFIDARSALTVENRSTKPKEVWEVNVTDEEGVPDEEAVVNFAVTKGSSLITIAKTPGGQGCEITLTGHGEAEITATLVNGRSAKVTVTCIVTPSRLDLPAFLADKGTLVYRSAAQQAFPFQVIVPEANASQQVTYTFEDIDSGETGASVGVYHEDNGTIEFKKTGNIRVQAQSVSGNSNGEISVSRDFTVNAGINVSTWEDLKTALTDADHAGKEVNIVVTQKPLGERYGYDIVPSAILNHATDPNDIMNINILIQNATTVNGNNHAINLSGLKYFSAIDHRMQSVFRFQSAAGMDVTLRDIRLLGNVGLDGKAIVDGTAFYQEQGSGKLRGVHARGIEIGTDNQAVYYNVTMDNVEVRNFHVGIRVARALPGSRMSGVEVDDCFTNGIEVAASKMELNNMTFGTCGAAGIEITHESSNAIGENNDELQTVTFTGYTNSENVNNGQTQYMKEYKVFNLTVDMIINGALIAGGYSNNQIAHVRNAMGEFNFFAFLFNDPPANVNYSELVMPGNGKIIDLSEIAEAQVTDYEFIRLPVIVEGMDIGDVYVANWYYQAAGI